MTAAHEIIDFIVVRGLQQMAAQQYCEARNTFAEALAACDPNRSLKNPLAGEILMHFGNANLNIKEYTAAESSYRLAAMVYMRAFGAQHPNVALALKQAQHAGELAEPGMVETGDVNKPQLPRKKTTTIVLRSSLLPQAM